MNRSQMVSWLKYFFGSFFSHNQARKGENRSIFNSILGLLLMFVLLTAGLTLGHNLAFPMFYDKADEFSSFVNSSLSGIELTVSDGTANCDEVMDGFSDGAGSYGYTFVVDTRDTAGLYDDFEALYVSSDGNEIPYAEYLTLSSSAKEDYTFKVGYTGRVLDIEDEEKQAEWTAYLGNLADPASSTYDSSAAESLADIEEAKDAYDAFEYAERIYCLYVQEYYPDISGYESYAQAPTIRGYYASRLTSDTSGKYLVLLDDQCMGAFYSGSIPVTFTGYYSKLDGFTTAAGGNLADTFVKNAYSSSSYMYILAYLSNILQIFLYVVVVWILMAIILMVVCKVKKIPYGYRFFSSLQIVGSFFFMSSLLAAASSFIASFFASLSTAYTVCIAVFYGLVIVRTIAYIVVELLLHRSPKPAVAEEGAEEAF